MKQERLISRYILFILFIIPLLILRFIENGFLLPKTSFFQINVYIMIVLYLLSFKQKIHIYFNRTLILFAVFIIFLSLTSLNSINKYVSYEFIYQNVFILLFILIIYHQLKKGSQNFAQQILTVITISAIIVALYGIFEYFGYDIFNWKAKMPATIGNKNFLAQYLVLHLFLPLLLIRKSDNIKLKIAFGIGFIIILISTIFTFSRNGLTALFLSGLLYFLLSFLSSNSNKKKVAITFISIIFLLFITIKIFKAAKSNIYQQIENNIVSAVKMRSLSVQFRFHTYIQSLGIIRDNPLIGVGIQNFYIHYPMYRDIEERKLSKTAMVHHAHSEPIEFATESGLLGLGLLILFLLSIIQKKYFQYKELFVSLFAFLVTSCFGFSFHIITGSLYFFVILIILIGKDAKTIRITFNNSIPVKFIIIAICILSIQFPIKKVHANYIYKRANLYRDNNYLKTAIEKYVQITELVPFHQQANYQTAKLSYKINEFGLGRTYEKRIFDIEPYNVNFLNNIGIVFIDKKMYQAALRKLYTSAQITYSFPQTYNNIAVIYDKLKKRSLSKKYLKLSLLLDHTNAETHFNLGELYKRMKDYKSAAEEFNTAIQYKDNYWSAYFILGQLYLYFLNKSDTALIYFQKVEDIFKNDPDFYYHYGNYYFYNKDYNKSEELYLKGLKQDEKFLPIMNNLGALYIEQKEYQKAEKIYMSVIKINPKSDEARFAKYKIQQLQKINNMR